MRYITLICTFIILTSIHTPVKSQFYLSGHISGAEKEELSINIPLVFGFYTSNSLYIPVAKDGSFSLEIPVKETRFVNLIYQRKFFQLLLQPGKALQVTLNKADTSLMLISGSALSVNQVVQKADIEEYPPFFDKDAAYYSSLSLTLLQQNLVTPYLAKRDKKIQEVLQSSIPSDDKQRITGELTAIAYNYINDLARTAALNKAVADSLIIHTFDHSDIQAIPSGPQFYAFADNYIRYLETKAFRKIKNENIPSTQPIPYFGISLDSANIFVKKYSKAQWRFLGAITNLPASVAEKYAFQLIISAVNYKELKQASDLAAAFRRQFPGSIYHAEVDRHLHILKQLLQQNEGNTAIKILPQIEKINSIYDVIKSLKGQVVYLDVWGTWCGPCKAELPYVPKLREKFKDKPIAFVYLDMDEDDHDSSWREFIKVNQMEGIHLRKNRMNIAPLWQELLANADDKAEYYPQYFIFDKEGRLVISKAKRPSQQEELYAQLNAVLNKK